AAPSGMRAPRFCSAEGHTVSPVTLTVADVVISGPVAIWRDYSGRTKTLDRYDLAPAGDPGLLADDEIRRTWIVASRISADERARLVIRAATAPWHDVPADSELAAADPAERDGLFDKAAMLYHHFAVPHQRGIGRSKIHKVLHLKRRGLYPVLDRNLVRLYKARAREWVDVIPGAAAGDSVTYWAASRSDLT